MEHFSRKQDLQLLMMDKCTVISLVEFGRIPTRVEQTLDLPFESQPGYSRVIFRNITGVWHVHCSVTRVAICVGHELDKCWTRVGYVSDTCWDTCLSYTCMPVNRDMDRNIHSLSGRFSWLSKKLFALKEAPDSPLPPSDLIDFNVKPIEVVYYRIY